MGNSFTTVSAGLAALSEVARTAYQRARVVVYDRPDRRRPLTREQQLLLDELARAEAAVDHYRKFALAMISPGYRIPSQRTGPGPS